MFDEIEPKYQQRDTVHLHFFAALKVRGIRSLQGSIKPNLTRIRAIFPRDPLFQCHDEFTKSEWLFCLVLVSMSQLQS
jgi:hypothetical protein